MRVVLLAFAVLALVALSGCSGPPPQVTQKPPERPAAPPSRWERHPRPGTEGAAQVTPKPVERPAASEPRSPRHGRAEPERRPAHDRKDTEQPERVSPKDAEHPEKEKPGGQGHTEEPSPPAGSPPASPSEEHPTPQTPEGSGKLAIVIDDVGSSTARIAPFLALDAPITFAIIPGTPAASQCLSVIRSHGRRAMAHLPMEPLQRSKMGPGAITVSMASDDVQSRVGDWLDSLPGIVGANNHTGSRATQDDRVVRAVLSEVRKRGLFFLDSRTTSHTAIDSVARELGVPHLSRDGRFLDDGGRTSETYAILMELGEIARRQGQAVGIGHPHPGTAKALARAIPDLAAMGVRIVPITDLVGH